MESPIEKIKEWYLSLPKDQQVDIGALVSASFPGFDEVGSLADLDSIPDKFIFAIDSFPRNKMMEVGMVLVLKTAIEFVFISKRCDVAGWKGTKAMMQDLADKHESETFQNSANQVDFRARQWLSTCEKWGNIRSFISDEYLNRYQFS